MKPSAFKITAGHTAGIHAVLARTAHVFPRHTHDDFGIGVITSGAQSWHSGRAQVEAGAGCAIAVNPGEVHDGSPIGGGRAWRMLYISPSVLQAAADDVFEDVRVEFEFAHPVLADPRIADLVRRLFAAETLGPPGLMRSEELLLEVTARAGHRRSADRPRIPATVAIAKKRIDENPASPLSLGCLANLCGVSRFQLLRSFARFTGFTPHAYLVQRRIDLARRLILRGEKLAGIAATSGFSDQSHMTRTFIRSYGVAPGEYARALR